MTNLKTEILEISRQNQTADLTIWFDQKLDEYIESGYFADHTELNVINGKLIADLRAYREQANVSTVVLGMSGGVDSALTAALFKNAGWRVIGVTMPIHQDIKETERGIEACDALGIECLNQNLSDEFDVMVRTMELNDPDIIHDTKQSRIRRGNIRARLRMITLYNLAALHGGLVASTDNYSELAVGFWTLHGDVGDVSPIQSLTKSWEVPMLAKMNGVPEATWKAKPTDGLGVDDGDEAQFGFTYLELDIVLEAAGQALVDGNSWDEIARGDGTVLPSRVASFVKANMEARSSNVFETAMKRVGSTWFKRMNPVNLKHPLDEQRYAKLEAIDNDLFVPAVVRN